MKIHIMSNIREYNIILVTHFLIYSASQALRDYLLKQKANSLLYISHPLPQIDASEKDYSFVEDYRKGQLVLKRTFHKKFQGLLLPVFLHFLLNIYWSIKSKKHIDIYIGIDNVNALSGIL